MLQHQQPLVTVLGRVRAEVVMTIGSSQGKPEARVLRVDGRKSLRRGKTAIFAPDEHLALGKRILKTRGTLPK